MKTMKNYHHLHLKCDVLLLADVFEKFGNSNLKNYGFLSHYLSTPASSWDAVLSMTKLELIFDVDMHLFFLKGMRDRVS